MYTSGTKNVPYRSKNIYLQVEFSTTDHNWTIKFSKTSCLFLLGAMFLIRSASEKNVHNKNMQCKIHRKSNMIRKLTFFPIQTSESLYTSVTKNVSSLMGYKLAPVHIKPIFPFGWFFGECIRLYIDFIRMGWNFVN